MRLIGQIYSIYAQHSLVPRPLSEKSKGVWARDYAQRASNSTYKQLTNHVPLLLSPWQEHLRSRLERVAELQTAEEATANCRRSNCKLQKAANSEI